MITHGPTGKVIHGHVLDVNKQAFDQALRFYDPQLYTTWNPNKLGGWGCWEIRRLPNKKTQVYQGTHQGVDYYKLQYVEFNTVHHVLDAAFLNYDAIRKLKSIDAWDSKNWVDQLEAREEAYREQKRAEAKEALKYAIQQNKSTARDFYELLRSGVHPAQVLLSTKWGPV